jgi:threonine/homoserine/homoserine lactone efflux protein
VTGLGQYAAFLGVCALVICTPGPDTALTIRNTLLGGRSAGAATAVGVGTGQAAWTAATSAGLALLLAASAPLFLGIRLAGAAYLGYLGTRSLLGAFRGHREPVNRLHFRSRMAARTAFTQGLLSNLSNPKMVAFFVGILPPFAGPHPSFAVLLGLGLNFCALTVVWLAAYAVAVDRLSSWFERSPVRRVFDGVLGAVLVGLGLRIGAEAVG